MEDALADGSDWAEGLAVQPAMVAGRPTCPTCGDEIFIEEDEERCLVMCVHDGTLIHLPRRRRDDS